MKTLNATVFNQKLAFIENLFSFLFTGNIIIITKIELKIVFLENFNAKHKNLLLINSYLSIIFGKINFPHEHFICSTSKDSVVLVRMREIFP